MSPPSAAIMSAGLRKSFGTQIVLDGIDLAVAEGTVFALLGPNGAGKTTMVQILSTLIRADGGQIRVAGHDPAADPDAVRAAIGVTGQYSALDKFLTGEENLILMADLHHLGRAEGRRRAAPGGLESALRTLGAASVDDDLTLRVPSDGSVRSLRAVLARLDDQSIEVEEMTVRTRPRRRLPRPHRPPRPGEGASAMSTLSYAAGDSATMLRRNLRHLVRYPSMTFTIAWSAGIALLAYLWARRLYSRDPVW